MKREAIFERLGARVASSVSSKTDYVIVGEGPGESKIARAHELGIPTLHVYTLVALGFFDQRTKPYSLSIPEDTFSSIALQMAVAYEECNAQAERGDADCSIALPRIRNAVLKLLSAAYGPTTGRTVEVDD